MRAPSAWSIVTVGGADARVATHHDQGQGFLDPVHRVDDRPDGGDDDDPFDMGVPEVFEG